MNTGIQRFFAKVEPLYKKRLPNLLVINDELSTCPDYSAQIMNKARDSSKVAAERLSMTGKAFLEALSFDLNNQYTIPNLFITRPTFAQYIGVDEVYRKLMMMNIPSKQHWDKLCELLEKGNSMALLNVTANPVFQRQTASCSFISVPPL